MTTRLVKITTNDTISFQWYIIVYINSEEIIKMLWRRRFSGVDEYLNDEKDCLSSSSTILMFSLFPSVHAMKQRSYLVNRLVSPLMSLPSRATRGSLFYWHWISILTLETEKLASKSSGVARFCCLKYYKVIFLNKTICLSSIKLSINLDFTNENYNCILVVTLHIFTISTCLT